MRLTAMTCGSHGQSEENGWRGWSFQRSPLFSIPCFSGKRAEGCKVRRLRRHLGRVGALGAGWPAEGVERKPIQLARVKLH
jgi:hypothetical protein